MPGKTLQLLAHAATRRLDPDDVAVLDAVLGRRLGVQLALRVLHVAPQPGDVAILTEEVEGLPEARAHDERVLLEQLRRRDRALARLAEHRQRVVAERLEEASNRTRTSCWAVGNPPPSCQ